MQNEEIRCGGCRKLLAKGSFKQLEIKCTRCGAFNHLNAPSITIEGHRASNLEKAREKCGSTAG